MSTEKGREEVGKLAVPFLRAVAYDPRSTHSWQMLGELYQEAARYA